VIWIIIIIIIVNNNVLLLIIIIINIRNGAKTIKRKSKFQKTRIIKKNVNNKIWNNNKVKAKKTTKSRQAPPSFATVVTVREHFGAHHRLRKLVRLIYWASRLIIERVVTPKAKGCNGWDNGIRATRPCHIIYEY
jgi:hypothetical protein